MANTTPEKGLSTAPSVTPDSAPAVVVQPSRVEFASLLDGIGKMSEQTGEDRSGDWSGSGGAVATTGGRQSTQATMTARDLAIANLPEPAVMQKELEKHIQEEVKNLRRQAKTIARIGRPGAAYRLNQLYARIHRLNAMLASIFDASVDVVKRLFIRVFIDKQTIQ
ncbi:MAG TPA: hypothetical protein VHA78_04010 [Candidatus Peribacteraceae bacterium]|nr:hypothetical protein [Candidatus Peribacteraceae bacterium]